MVEPSEPHLNVRNNILRGSAWAIALRWGVRLTGFVSTIILARLLTPADFGIVAMAMIVVGAIEVLNETGQKLAIIRHPSPDRAHLDSAWTLQVLIGATVAAIILAIAPLTARVFGDPRAIPVMQWLSLRALFGGFENIGVVFFRRELNFARDFRYAVIQKLIAFVVTVGLAFLWRNYWALVAGIVVGRAAGVALSYLMHDFRPRVSFLRTRELWSFSIWLLLKTIGQYANLKVDEATVGICYGAPLMGSYSVGADLAAAPTQEIAIPVSAALFPVFATIRGDNGRLRDSYLDVLYTIVFLCLPISVGVALVAKPLVDVVLGDKWGQISPLISWLSLASGTLAIGNTAYVIFDVTGRPRISAQMQWLRVFVLTGATIVAAVYGSVADVAIARFGTTVLMIPTLLLGAASVLQADPAAMFARLLPPAAATGAMALAVGAFQFSVPIETPVVRLFAESLLGAAVFAGSTMAIWLYRGKPGGIERLILERVQVSLKVLRRRLQKPTSFR